MILIPLSVIYNYNPKSDHVISSTFIYIHMATSIFCHFHENKVQAVSQQISRVKLCPVQQVILLKSSNLFIHFVKLSFLNVFHLPLFWMFFTLFLFPIVFFLLFLLCQGSLVKVSAVTSDRIISLIHSLLPLSLSLTHFLSLSQTFSMSLSLSLSPSLSLLFCLSACLSIHLSIYLNTYILPFDSI